VTSSWTLVTVTYNSAEALRRFGADSLPDGIEWVVVDNASEDDSARVAEDQGASVVRLAKNVGFSAANNVGLARAAGDYIAFVNPDVAVRTSDLTRLEAALREHGECLVAPQLLNLDSSPQPNGRGMPTMLRKVANRLSASETPYRVFASPGEVRFIAWAMGAAVAGRRDTFERLGGWDERYFVYYEDSDLGLRSWAAQVPVLLIGDVRWIHGWARETMGLSLRAWRHELRGATRFFARYPGLLLSERLVGRQLTSPLRLSGRNIDGSA
jgi:N-acetylglucosaminyl-diphospho-decaprenol L-rhamnosyltransferase